MFGQPASFLSSVGDALTNWITLVVFMAALGVAAGLLIFVYVFPGQPKIGVIEIPYTVISDNSAYAIGEYLNYAREDDSSTVVIQDHQPWGAPPPGALTSIPQALRRKPVVW